MQTLKAVASRENKDYLMQLRACPTDQNKCIPLEARLLWGVGQAAGRLR